MPLYFLFIAHLLFAQDESVGAWQFIGVSSRLINQTPAVGLVVLYIERKQKHRLVFQDINPRSYELKNISTTSHLSSIKQRNAELMDR